jgi:hypothetical protein
MADAKIQYVYQFSSNTKTNMPPENCWQSHAATSRSFITSASSSPELTLPQRVRDCATRRARIHVRTALDPPDCRKIAHTSPHLMPEQQEVARTREGV